MSMCVCVCVCVHMCMRCVRACTSVGVRLCDNLPWFDKSLLQYKFYWVLPQLFTIIDSVSTYKGFGFVQNF